MSAIDEKGFNPTFENGGFWEYYKDLERQFDNFLVDVPYLKGNENTYSFRLANLILAIGAHIDSAFKEIAKYSIFSTKYPEILKPKTKGGRTRQPNITDYFPLSEEYKLSERVVTFKCLPKREDLGPFQQYQKTKTKKGREKITHPYWWTAYNGVKHNFNKNFKKANLKTVRDALAGAFLLNVIHVPASKRLFDYHLLKPKYPQGETMWKPEYDTFEGQKMLSERPRDKKIENPFIIETSLFVYDYEKLASLKSP